MPIEHDQVKTLAAIAVLVAAFVGVVWLPAHAERRELNQRIADARKRVRNDNSEAADHIRLARQVDTLQQQAARFSHYVPTEGELAQFIRQLSNELAAEDAADPEIKTNPIVQQGQFSEIPVVLRFNATFTAAFNALRRIEGMDRLVRVKRLELTSSSERGDDAKPLGVRMDLSTFFTSGEGQHP